MIKSKTLKSIISVLIAGLLLVCSSLVLAGCKDDEDSAQVMVLSVNPSVEFVLDEDDKVVSVTATNEDGAYIIQKFNFMGMEADDAAKKFIELCDVYGFVVSGTSDGETFTISISGSNEEVEELYRDVKKSVKNKANELGLTIANVVKISKDELKNIVAECYQEYTQAEINKLSEEKLVEMLQKSRKETKDLYTEEDRLDYYLERLKTIVTAKLEKIKTYANDSTNAILNGFVESLDLTYQEFINIYNNITSEMMAEKQAIETERAEYIAEKQAYLAKVKEYKQLLITGTETEIENMKQSIDEYKQIAENTYSQLEINRQAFQNELAEIIDNQIQTQLELFNTTLDQIIELLDIRESEINAYVNVQIDILIKGYTATNPWEDINSAE